MQPDDFRVAVVWLRLQRDAATGGGAATQFGAAAIGGGDAATGGEDAAIGGGDAAIGGGAAAFEGGVTTSRFQALLRISASSPRGGRDARLAVHLRVPSSVCASQRVTKATGTHTPGRQVHYADIIQLPSQDVSRFRCVACSTALFRTARHGCLKPFEHTLTCCCNL